MSDAQIIALFMFPVFLIGFGAGCWFVISVLKWKGNAEK